MKNNEKVIIIYDKNAENIEKKIIKAFEKYLQFSFKEEKW